MPAGTSPPNAWSLRPALASIGGLVGIYLVLANEEPLLALIPVAGLTLWAPVVWWLLGRIDRETEALGELTHRPLSKEPTLWDLSLLIALFAGSAEWAATS